MTIRQLPKTVFFVGLEVSSDEVPETLKSRMNLWDGCAGLVRSTSGAVTFTPG